jgi:hypothetical protein
MKKKKDSSSLIIRKILDIKNKYVNQITLTEVKIKDSKNNDVLCQICVHRYLKQVSVFFPFLDKDEISPLRNDEEIMRGAARVLSEQLKFDFVPSSNPISDRFMLSVDIDEAGVFFLSTPLYPDEELQMGKIAKERKLTYTDK